MFRKRFRQRVDQKSIAKHSSLLREDKFTDDLEVILRILELPQYTIRKERVGNYRVKLIAATVNTVNNDVSIVKSSTLARSRDDDRQFNNIPLL